FGLCSHHWGQLRRDSNGNSTKQEGFYPECLLTPLARIPLCIQYNRPSSSVNFNKCPPPDDYGTLLLAEALLEECLQDNISLLRNATPLTDINQPKLARSKGFLNSILSRGRLGPRHLNEALLLMAKIHYVQGRYRDAQGMCARVGIEELTGDGQPVYHLRLLADAFVIKGLSLDHQAVSAASRVRLSEREEECMTCYLRACDTALVYLQELDKKRLLTVVKFNVKHTCVLLWHPMVQAAARKLAEVLLSSVSEDSYWAPTALPPSAWLQREGNASQKDALYPSTKLPQRYSTDRSEDLLPVLRASGEAVISRAPDQKEARETSLQDATSVYDLLSIGMARRGQYGMLSECLERAMKFSYNEFHLWHQLGLSLMACGKGVSAVSVLKECARMRPEDPSLPMLAAKVCINQLHWLEEAEALSQSVVAMGEGAAEFLPRAYLTMGLCCSLQASDGKRRDLRPLHCRAHALDAHDAKIALYLALQLAVVRQVSAAMDPLQVSLSLQGDDLHSLHLLTLLLSAQKHYQHALETLTLALSQHPDNFNLLFTKVKLEEVLYGPGTALQTCEDMLQIWQSRYDFTRTSEGDDSSSIHPPEPPPPSRKLSGHHLNLPDFQDADTGSQSGPSLAASRLEQAMSELSANSSAQKQGPAYIWTTLECIWLQAGELFMAEGRVKEAQFCVQEAAVLFPNSHSVLLLRGRLAELRGNQDEAKSFYDEALAIHPNGHRILLHLGRLLVQCGRVGLGEKVLRDAVQSQSTSHEAWSSLGEALQSRGSSQAPDCFLTALELEASCPIRPFTVIPREL
uniref:Tetratricopeptide repeat protein 7 N-terminal domain-containing protein n=1 Tax=Esox lucius TaxID=8010 RepID=A0A6Q2XJ13_ESOLU